MKQSLVLFTADFPFGTGEAFLETEIIYLCRNFQKVTIISQNAIDEQTRSVPSNCNIKRINIDHSLKIKTASLFQLFNPVFWQELKIIKTIYEKKYTFKIIKTMLISLERGRKVKNYICKYFGRDINTTLFYSYWCDDTALGIALSAKRQRIIKGITRVHGWDAYFDVHSINYLPFRKFISNNLTALFPISEKGRDTIVSVWKSQNENISVARLGVINTFTPLFYKNDTFKIISCSNVIPLKRIHLIIEALKQINNVPVEWIHFGDGPLMNNIIKESQKLPKSIKVTFKGRVSNEQIYKFYSTSQPHLFINVSSSEGIPVSIMEAMSFGIPVIATNVGGNGEIVTNKNGCLLSTDPMVDEIAEQMRRFIDMDLLTYQQYAENAYDTWNKKYNAEINYSKFAETILRLNR